MRVAIETHGCRLNQSDSDAMAAALRAAGHTVVEAIDRAEVYVLSGCTITHQADADARRAVRRAARDRPELRVVVTGCFAAAEPRIAAALPGVDLVLGNPDKDRLVALVERLAALPPRSSAPRPTAPLIEVSALTRHTPFTTRSTAPSTRARALLKVQDGCNHRCAFCIVPRVRGPSRSLSIDQVLDDARALVAQGVPELVLTGVHLGGYGHDLRPRRRLVDLVAALVPVLGPARLRLSSIDPHEVDEGLLALMAAHPEAICRHLHLPVQAGDDGTLRRMRRAHTVETFTALVQRATARIPGIAIGSDVIVGFPGEDAAAFERGEARLRALPLAYLHVFPFSPRRGTAAATMPDPVAPPERAHRGARLRALSQAMEAAHRRARAGSTADAVVHRRPRRDGQHEALTDDFLRVTLVGDAAAADARASGASSPADVTPCAVEPRWAGRRVRLRLHGDGRHAWIETEGA